jgi:transposase-like protein
MPWKEYSVKEERLRFVARLLEGESMTDVCREFGVSRKTGYKVFDRFKEHGMEGPDRPVEAPCAICQPASEPDRDPHSQPQEREAPLGCEKDP